jgi:hypothetical protein
VAGVVVGAAGGSGTGEGTVVIYPVTASMIWLKSELFKRERGGLTTAGERVRKALDNSWLSADNEGCEAGVGGRSGFGRCWGTGVAGRAGKWTWVGRISFHWGKAGERGRFALGAIIGGGEWVAVKGLDRVDLGKGCLTGSDDLLLGKSVRGWPMADVGGVFLFSCACVAPRHLGAVRRRMLGLETGTSGRWKGTVTFEQITLDGWKEMAEVACGWGRKRYADCRWKREREAG